MFCTTLQQPTACWSAKAVHAPLFRLLLSTLAAMNFERVALLLLFIGTFAMLQGAELDLSKFSNKKLMELIDDCFEDEHTLTCLAISEKDQEHLEKPMPDGSLFAVRKGGNTLGYAYVSRAEGRGESFDYAIIFDAKLNTLRVKILEYRPPYGGSIASKHWLKQFVNQPISRLFEFRKDVDTISGATISAMAITEDINRVKKNMQALGRMGVFRSY